ncbi:EamA family transporter [Geothermobacter hydrogeniphilus]|uniref:EamA family transporter n=1 Tax=Geothermobacter hydrogeniphilus TaxID=1969733 RepID=A0A1X0XX26_9BACT|nr:EamA family transporter [Geothermobacter hydrogeniphilus]ORJ57473.1 EamA family transporter [Geothermobacter hydrogeniphilus]
MSSLAFALILLSALMHALWNLLVKQSGDKTAYIWWMFLQSGILFSLIMLLAAGPFPPLSPRLLLLTAGGAVCFVLYHLFTGRAYREGDLSMTYPLAQTAMLYVPLWGVLLLKEHLSPLGVAGILLIAMGAYAVQLRTLRMSEVLRPFHYLGSSSVRFALAAGLVYSFGAVIDKSGVTRYDPLHFTYLLVVWMLLLMSLNLLRSGNRGRIPAEWRRHPRLVLCAGPVMLCSFLSFRYGLQLAPMSYAVPVRQASLLIAVLIGVVFLGERAGRIRFGATLLILAGVCLVRFG